MSDNRGIYVRRVQVRDHCFDGLLAERAIEFDIFNDRALRNRSQNDAGDGLWLRGRQFEFADEDGRLQSFLDAKGNGRRSAARDHEQIQAAGPASELGRREGGIRQLRGVGLEKGVDLGAVAAVEGFKPRGKRMARLGVGNGGLPQCRSCTPKDKENHLQLASHA